MSRTVAILQSSYLPWKGYFDIIHDADVFVFYDDVQFTKHDWRSRNRIKTHRGTQWLSIPVGEEIDRRICDVELPAGRWRDKHHKTLAQTYSRAPHYEWVKPLLDELFASGSFATLSQLNQHAITRIARDYLGIATELVDSRSYDARGARTQRLLDLLGKLGATRYVSGPSARAYLDEPLFAEHGIELVYKDYAGYREYPQPFPPFDHRVSVIDLLCNVGPAAPDYIWGMVRPASV